MSVQLEAMAVVFGFLTGSYVAGNLCLSRALPCYCTMMYAGATNTAELGKAGRFSEEDLAPTTSNPITSYADHTNS